MSDSLVKTNAGEAILDDVGKEGHGKERVGEKREGREQLGTKILLDHEVHLIYLARSIPTLFNTFKLMYLLSFSIMPVSTTPNTNFSTKRKCCVPPSC